MYLHSAFPLKIQYFVSYLEIILPSFANQPTQVEFLGIVILCTLYRPLPSYGKTFLFPILGKSVAKSYYLGTIRLGASTLFFWSCVLEMC